MIHQEGQASREESSGTFERLSLRGSARASADMCTCARVRAWKRGRDVLETREAIEHLFRQTGELIAVQVDGPAEDTHETARTQIHARQPKRVSAGRRARVPQAARGSDSHGICARERVRKERNRIEARQTQGPQRETRTDGAANAPLVSDYCYVCLCVRALT